MVNGYSLDPHPKANYAKEHFAVVKIPKSNRGRVPSASVTIMQSLEEARENANEAEKLFVAEVVGPARSSEGFELYYIKKIYD
jgi:hypothetical protein